MKISISTFYRDSHPGAVLQAYALSRTLRSLGHEPEVLAYARPKDEGGVRKLRQRIVAMATMESETTRQYGAFRSRFLVESKSLYRSYAAIVANPPQAGAFICGSDQIWNPSLLAGKRFDPAYFLQFGPAEIPRIAYAASFGGYRPGPEQEELLRSYLSNFSAISMREPAGQAILSKILGRETGLTLDPCLLLDDYRELLEPSPDAGRYVLLYCLQNSAEIRDTARAVAAYYGLPIWSVGGPLLPWKSLGRRVNVLNPIEWINLIHGAAAVVTNSFHGMVFGLLLRKPTVVVPLMGEMKDRNERLFHLCDLLGMRDIVVSTDSRRTLSKDLDWDTFHMRLSERREASLAFLRSALSTA